MNLFDNDDRDSALAWLSKLGSVSPDACDKFEQFLTSLAAENSRQNLVAQGTLPFAWTRHVVDSVQLISHVPRETSETWLDLGTGAGFPGLVCAIVMPQTKFTLVEQRPLRTAWLEEQADALDLQNVTIKPANLSALEVESFDVISARAFAPLPRLLKLSAAFSTNATTWVLPKGRSASQELLDLKGWQHMFHVEQSVTDPQSGIITGRLLGRVG
ncbi:16S rRNA (guanine(527)-N(7))-methyltransferase RsmG [Croceicoccus ponticola]|uniref:Ribosomal RNA small subunit methyltransferase G n=1 Tax=Croceicoccus ponticola TaxID=2217664 RepID=A0A437GYG3_9SPHN|nr:16S rRNA (guanine(527)-N(7))-methyltransferase RsmG [Croceicoccus ponticola]RVQ67712.1 16S rRNA (guanine(527)-N(7))-methyltransferase RsmG [Croceicoccus ponticola]